MHILRIEVTEPSPGALCSVVTARTADGFECRGSNRFPNPWTSEHAAKLEWLREVLPGLSVDNGNGHGNGGGAANGLRVGRQLLLAGVALFRRILLESPMALAAWNEVRNELYRTRVEISSATSIEIPWNILRDPSTGKVLAETAAVFQVMEALPPATDWALAKTSRS